MWLQDLRAIWETRGTERGLKRGLRQKVLSWHIRMKNMMRYGRPPALVSLGFLMSGIGSTGARILELGLTLRSRIWETTGIAVSKMLLMLKECENVGMAIGKWSSRRSSSGECAGIVISMRGGMMVSLRPKSVYKWGGNQKGSGRFVVEDDDV
jgi:hypothetical protein